MIVQNKRRQINKQKQQINLGREQKKVRHVQTNNSIKDNPCTDNKTKQEID